MGEYSKILDMFNIQRCKCIECGNDIEYYDTKAKIKKNGELKIYGKSWKSTKTVNNVTYHLVVCQNCLLNRFEIKNLSRVFNLCNAPTIYAFNIDEESAQAWRKENISITRKNLINKYGEFEGNKRWEDYVDKQKITKSWEYMVEKYGEEKARQINKSKAITLENFQRKYGNNIGKEKYLLAVQHINQGVSNKSQQIFRALDKYIAKKYTTLYASKNTEYTVICGNKYYKLDYYIPELKIAVEYNGSIFHADNRIYSTNDKPNPWSDKTAAEIWEYDKQRIADIESQGISVFIIWEYDFSENFDYKSFILNKLKINL